MSKGTVTARHAMHRCIKCGEKIDVGQWYCLTCRMDENARRRQHWPDRIINGINERHNEYLRKRRAEARANGMCIMCCKRPAAKGKTSCAWCLARQNERLKRKLDGKRMTDAGGCLRCGKPLVDGYRLCADCLPKAQAQMLYARSKRKTPNYFEKLHVFEIPV